MKVFFISILAFSVGFIASNTIINAQADNQVEDQAPIIQNSEGLRSTFVQNVQDPNSKTVVFDMVVESTISSDRVRVTWEKNGNSIFTETYPLTYTTSVQTGQTHVYSIELQVIGAGVTELIGTVRVSDLEGSAITTVRKNFVSNEEGEILPITDEYRQAKLNSQIVSVLVWVLVLIIFFGLSFFGFRKFMIWYKKDDVLDFEEKNNF